MTLEEVLPAYSSVEGHSTRCEKHTHKLSNITDYLLTAKYGNAQAHAEEVAEFFATLDEAATAIFRVIHDRHTAAPQVAIAAAQAPAPAPARASVTPSAELKSKELSHDASIATFRMWKKQFRAYYDTGSLGTLPCT